VYLYTKKLIPLPNSGSAWLSALDSYSDDARIDPCTREVFFFLIYIILIIYYIVYYIVVYYLPIVLL